MSKFHSTVSRRAFMKGLGLAGAGLGAAAATTPVFHDLDELTASKNAVRKLPWYIKEREFFDTTVEIDWQNKERYDKRNNVSHTPEEKLELTEKRCRLIKEGVVGNIPGDTLRDLALLATTKLRISTTLAGPETSVIGGKTTRESLGLPKWQGSPEENLRTVTSVLRHWGSPQIGVVEMTEKTKLCWYKCDSRGKLYTFADVDKAYSDTNNAAVIPNSARWVISYVIPQSGISKLRLSTLGFAGTHGGYQDDNFLEARLQCFLRMLGYQGITSRSGGNNVGLGTLAGNGEHGRSDYLISPIKGGLVRKAEFMVTDLPLAPTKPIDFGCWRFCQTCKKCGEVCPAGAIPLDDEPTYETTGLWNGYGLKSYHVDYKTCLPWRGTSSGPMGHFPAGCGNCQGVCVFSKLNEASIHVVIAQIVATTGLFNTFFKAMDDTFDYGAGIDPIAWWNRDPDTYPFKGTQIGI